MYNNVFLFEMYKWSDECEDEYKWAFLTSQADSRLITDNENREGWYFRMKDLRKLILDLAEDKSQENKIYRIKKNYEKDRPQLFKRIMLVKQDYILNNISHKIIKF